MVKKQKWYFTALNKDLVNKKNKLQDNECKHEKWIAKCSTCGKILASETQNVTDADILSIVNRIIAHRNEHNEENKK